jgi:outer membrane protein
MRSAAALFALLLALPLAFFASFSAQAQNLQNPQSKPQASPLAPAHSLSSPLGDLLNKANGLINSKRSEEAFKLLKASEESYAGSIDFDYVLGLAANDAQQPGQAILALERVLLAKPDFLQARAELARAYALAKETENAKREFESLSEQPIPPEVKRTISQYLNALQGKADNKKLANATHQSNSPNTKTSLIFESFVGRDSNVNFGTALDQWVLAGGLTVIPQGNSKPQKSWVFGANLGASWLIPISGDIELTAGGQVGMRSQASAHTLDPVNAEVFAGVTKKVKKHTLSSGIQLQQLWLDGSPFRDALGVFAQWQSPSDGRVQWGAYAQRHQFDYPSQTIRNANRSTIGLTLAGLTGTKNSVVLIGSIYGGKEQSTESADYLSFEFLGLRTATTKHFSPSFRASLVGSYEKRSFKAIDAPLFSDLRVDQQIDLRAALEIDVSKSWQISPQIIATRNRSTLGPNDYKRTQALLYARYRF